MKNHLIDATITAESVTTMAASLTTLLAELTPVGILLDDAQRKHYQHMGTRNETFSRDMLSLATERPELVPAGISLTALQRDLIARDQLTPILFQLKAITRLVEDTHTALGMDLYNGGRAMYKAVKPIALINGVADIIARIGLRFARPSKAATTPPPEGGTTTTSNGTVNPTL
jgi:hypothetical protein